MKKTRVLVCGATGFIGRNIAQALARREDLDVAGTCLRTRPWRASKMKWVKADLTRPADVARALRGCQVLIQAAATTSGSKDIVTRPFVHVTDNAVMNSLLFRAAHEQKVERVVFFSCTVMYPSGPVPVKEADFSADRELHRSYFGVGWTKVYIEKMCEFYSRIGTTKYTAIRHSNIYGPHDKYDLERSHVFGATVTKVMTAAEGKVTVWGTGEEGRDLLHVDDLTALVENVLDRQTSPFELVNAGAGHAVTVKELVRKVIEASGRDLRIEHDLSKPSIPTTLCVDCAKAKALFGWEPKVGLDEGIRRTLEWYAHGDGSRRAV